MKKYGRDPPLTDVLRRKIDDAYMEGVPEEFVKDFTLPEWVAFTTRIYLQKVRGRISELNKTKNAVLILDTTSPSRENKSESDFLQELLQIYNSEAPINPRPGPIKAKRDFLDALRQSRERYVHISAHGTAHDEEGNLIETTIQAGIWGKLKATDIYKKSENGTMKLWSKKDQAPHIIVATACEAGRRDLANAFWRTGCKYYVAPLRKVPWVNSAVFSTLFYYYLLVKHWSPFAAFRKTIEMVPDQTGAWRFYEKGKERKD